MRNRFFILFVALSVLCFGFARKIDVTQKQPAIFKAVDLIKGHVNDKGLINVMIVNSHNGRYIITSSVCAGTDSVRVLTHIVDMSGGQRDTTINLHKRDFLSKLDRARDPINSTKLAGHHQHISVKKNEIEETFETSDGRALMNLLEYGE